MTVLPGTDFVLMYHSVGSDEPAPAFRRYVLDPKTLDGHLRHLARAGWCTTTISESLDKGQGSQRSSIALTFDDGYADFIANVLPALERYDMVATLYVTTANVGGSARWLSSVGEAGRPLLDWTALQDIAESGRVEIGAHSHTHPEMDRLPNARVLEEARLPKIILEDRLQLPIRTFSYPFGYYDRRSVAAVRRVGYASACVVDDLPVSAARSIFTIPRLSVINTTNLDDLDGILVTSGSVVRRARSSLVRFVWRGYRCSPLRKREACDS